MQADAIWSAAEDGNGRSWWRHFAGAKLMAPTLCAESGHGDVDGRSTERIGEYEMAIRDDEEDHEKIRRRQQKTGLKIITHRKWTCVKIFDKKPTSSSFFDGWA